MEREIRKQEKKLRTKFCEYHDHLQSFAENAAKVIDESK